MPFRTPCRTPFRTLFRPPFWSPCAPPRRMLAPRPLYGDGFGVLVWRRRHEPRCMDEPRWHVLQLRHPEPNIGPFRVIVVGLLDDVEAPSFARVVPDAGGIVPVTIVGAHIVVDQYAFEPLRTRPPVHLQGVHEETGHVLSPAVGHEAGGYHLAHVGINERHARAALTPPFQRCRVASPWPRLLHDARDAEH